MDIIDRKKLKGILKARGWTLKQLAEAISVSQCTVSNVVNGKTRPSYEVMNGMLYALDMTPKEFTDCFFKKNLTSCHMNVYK